MSVVTLHFIGGRLDGQQCVLTADSDLGAACSNEGYRVELRPVPDIDDPRALCVPAEWTAEEARTALLQQYGRQPGLPS